MIQFGYNVGFLNATETVIKNFIQNVHESRTNTTFSDDTISVLWSLVVSFYDVGGMVGILMAGLITNLFGSKQGMLVINIFGIVGTLLIILSKPVMCYEIIILGRLLTGCHGGINNVLVPMYLSEISPQTIRGGVGTLTNVSSATGLVLSMILALREILGNNEGWPYLLGLSIIPSILQLILLPFCPASPRFLLITKHEESAAQNVLERLRCTAAIDDELEEIKAEKRLLEQEPQLGLLEVMTKKEFRRPLRISVLMQISLQLSGYIIIFYYSTNLFIRAGIKENVACYATAGLGVIMLIVGIAFISLMDIAGRRILYLIGLGGMFFCGIIFTVALVLSSSSKWMSYLVVISVFVFVIFFGMGPASIKWIIVAELFTQSARPAAMSIALFIFWLAKIIVGLLFPVLRRSLDDYILLPFTISLIFSWAFAYVAVPETKNKTFVEISELFKNK